MGISNQLKGSKIYLDANIFIYLLEGYSEFVPVLTQLFALIDKDTLSPVTSELTLAEVLVKPIMNKNIALEQTYTNIIQTSASLKVSSITRDILISAAKLRANISNSFRLPDA